jgi:hypothetical protein
VVCPPGARAAGAAWGVLGPAGPCWAGAAARDRLDRLDFWTGRIARIAPAEADAAVTVCCSTLVTSARRGAVSQRRGDAVASRGTTFAKLDRERARKAKQAEKRERRFAASAQAPTAPSDPPEIPEGEELSASALLQLVEDLHRAYDEGSMSFEDFEARKTELMARISVQ